MRSRIDFNDKNLVERGFTLIELLVVIVILGVLAAVVVFAVNGITNKGQSNACQIEVRTVNTALQAYYAQSTPSVFPTGTDVNAMFSALNTKGLLQQNKPGATSAYTPTYDGAGNFAASCP